ncbi:MAG: protease HtpX [Planctomycetota bacterium]
MRFGRVMLFVLLNIVVMVTLSIIAALLGLDRYFTARGLNYPMLMAFCLVWGMGGALISLLLSRIMAKMALGVEVIDPGTQDPREQELLNVVHRLATDAGLSTMPEVGVYNSPEVNAFATGPTRSRSLVAVSTGLLQRMEMNEVRAVLGHELGHVTNGDMVTMTLIQGVVNAFVMFLSKVIAFAIATAMADRGRDDKGRGSAPISWMAYYLIEIVLQIVLMIPAMMLVCWFSRWREFRADAAGARLAGRRNMIAALETLRGELGRVDNRTAPALQTLKISSQGTGLMRFFMSHPPLEERIARLQSGAE